MSAFRDSFGRDLAARHADEVHRFGNVDGSARGVLLIYGCDHQPVADHQLIVDLSRRTVILVVKAQRSEVHVVLVDTAQKLAPQIGNQSVAQGDDVAERLGVAEGGRFLTAVADGAVVAHQRREQREAQPSQQQIAGTAAVEAADVRAAVEKAAHVQPRHLLKALEDVTPPAVVVARPDTARAVCADIGRTREQERRLRAQFLQCVHSALGHLVAVEVMHVLVAESAFGGVVVESGVVLVGIRQAGEDVPRGEVGQRIECFALELPELIESAAERLFAVEKCRLVHVVPEAVDARVGQRLVLHAEPSRCLGTEEIRQTAHARPHADDKVLAVLILAEVAFLMSLVIDAVALFALDGGVDDRDQVDVALLHLLDKALEIREPFAIDSEVLEPLHIVDVEVDHVDRDARLFVLVRDGGDVLAVDIAPAALTVAEAPDRRDVALADQRTELAHDIAQGVGFDDVYFEMQLLGGDRQHIGIGVTNVKGQARRIVDEHAEAIVAVDDQEIVCAVERAFVLGVERIVAAPALIDPSALVDPADSFAESVDPRIRGHLVGEHAVIKREIGQGSALARDAFDHRTGVDHGGVAVLSDHRDPPS